MDLGTSVEGGIEEDRFGVEEEMCGAERVVGGRSERTNGTFEASSSERRADIDLSQCWLSRCRLDHLRYDSPVALRSIGGRFLDDFEIVE